MSRLLRATGRGIRAVGAFVWDFVVGDDWTAAIGVVAVLALARLTGAWWLLPPAVIGVLALTLVRARRAATRTGRPVEGGPSPH
jgi:hypothetical protein